MSSGRILLTGATGFVGDAVYPMLRARGWQVTCATRSPQAARARQPDRRWVHLDVDDPRTLAPALIGHHASLYLIHGMRGARGEYIEQEALAAERFGLAAKEAGLQRVVYLGGILPQGPVSTHLASRIEAGRALRQAFAQTVELRASMIVGPRSESWMMVRDLATRLPALVLPAWTESRTQPIAVEDIVFALVESLALPASCAGVYDAPGPETLSGHQILTRIARAQGQNPYVVRVPHLAPVWTQPWLGWLTRADKRIARELVHGLTSDIVSHGRQIWTEIPSHARVSFDEAVRRALRDECAFLSWRARVMESVMHRFTRKTDGNAPRLR